VVFDDRADLLEDAHAVLDAHTDVLDAHADLLEDLTDFLDEHADSLGGEVRGSTEIHIFSKTYEPSRKKIDTTLSGWGPSSRSHK
jgi:hypothetical protein